MTLTRPRRLRVLVRIEAEPLRVTGLRLGMILNTMTMAMLVSMPVSASYSSKDWEV